MADLPEAAPISNVGAAFSLSREIVDERLREAVRSRVMLRQLGEDHRREPAQRHTADGDAKPQAR
jgi:hypothetical protein